MQSSHYRVLKIDDAGFGGGFRGGGAPPPPPPPRHGQFCRCNCSVLVVTVVGLVLSVQRKLIMQLGGGSGERGGGS